MRTPHVSTAAALLLLVLAVPALPLAAEYPPGPVVAGDWPAGLADLLNSRERVYAYFVNEFDCLHYYGDTASFSAFLMCYSQVSLPQHVLVLHPGQGTAKKLGGEEFAFDWSLTGESWGSYGPDKKKLPAKAKLELWLEGKVKLKDVVIPENVQVQFAEGVKEDQIPFLQALTGRSSMTAPLEFGKLIPVLISAGSKKQPNQVNLQWIRFAPDECLLYWQYAGGPKQTVAELHGTIISWPKAKWQVRVELLDAEGKQLDAKSSVLESSGMILGRPGMSPVDLRFFFSDPALSKAKSFRVSIADEPDATPVTPSSADETPQALKDIQEAKLGQIALVIKQLSQGKSRLLTDDCAGANLPISVCPLSEPVRTKLEGVGDCILLGSVALLVGAEAPGASESTCKGEVPFAEPGVYLLAYKGEISDKQDETGQIALVSVSVDKDGRSSFKQSLGVPAVRHTDPENITYGDLAFYGASVQFPRKEWSRENPTPRATVLLALHEPDGRYRRYSFQLDLHITML